MALSAEQLAVRRTGVTATDITKIVGLSNYGGAIDVLLDKRGTPALFVETDRVKWGNILETPIRVDYANRHQANVLGGDEVGTLRHSSENWILATPDGLAAPRCNPVGPPSVLGPQWGWECKTHTGWLSHLYGDAGTDQVPQWELVQCQWNLIVARSIYGEHLTRWDLTAFIDGVPTDYTIEHDEELAIMLIEAGRSFWFDHVIGGEELDPDGSDSFGDYLARRFPQNSEEMVEASGSIMETVEGLRFYREKIRIDKEAEAVLVQVLKQAIGDASGLRWGEPSKKITWRKSKDSTKTDWKATVSAIRNQLVRANENTVLAVVDELIEANTKPKLGSRRFVVPKSWSE